MQDLEKFIDRGSKFMAATRPDLWTGVDARATLLGWKHTLDANPEFEFVSSGGFTLRVSRYGDVEYELSMDVVSLIVYADGGTFFYDWKKGNEEGE